MCFKNLCFKFKLVEVFLIKFGILVKIVLFFVGFFIIFKFGIKVVKG